MPTYLKIDEVKAGDTVMLDNGFTCIGPGPVVLQETSDGHLYFECHPRGMHFIDGQIDDTRGCGTLVGISRVEND